MAPAGKENGTRGFGPACRLNSEWALKPNDHFIRERNVSGGRPGPLFAGMHLRFRTMR
jgi:hypothetical protein